MRRTKNGARLARYEIRIKNHLDFHWERWFEGMVITLTNGGVTILSGEVIDQPALHGILEKIRNLNLTLLSVQRVDIDQENFQDSDQ